MTTLKQILIKQYGKDCAEEIYYRLSPLVKEWLQQKQDELLAELQRRLKTENDFTTED